MREERVAGAGGLQLFVRSWPPLGPARAVIAIVHGFKSHSGYYLWAGERLAASGFAVYAVDLRGRGHSEGRRLSIEHISEYVGDAATLVALAKSREPGLPVFLLGHSAGGVISSVYALDHQSELAGLVCESFAFQVFAPDLVLSILRGVSRVLPRARVLKLPNKDFSRDPAVVRAMDEDPLLAGEVQPARTVAAMLGGNDRLMQEFPRITLPVLILHGAADKVTRPSGSRLFHERAGSRDKTLKLYDGHAHDLLGDVGKETVLADITRWIEAHLPGK